MKRTPAFTLIELLIVVAIIAILAAIAVPNFLEAQTRAKVSRCKNDLRVLATAWEAYRVDYNRYPPDYDSGQDGGSAGYRGEEKTYRCVTTPVAYITSVPVDIFQLDDDRYSKQGRFYLYWGTTTNLRSFEWISSGTMWLMAGYGPDKDWDTHGHYTGTAINQLYDPTNGTISSGDLGRTNVKSYPE